MTYRFPVDDDITIVCDTAREAWDLIRVLAKPNRRIRLKRHLLAQGGIELFWNGSGI